jgi:hypothetical protein
LKVLEEKFDFYFKEEKKNVDDVNYVWSIQHFMTIENGIFCDFASFSNKEFDHSKFFSDISSIKVKGSKLTIMNSYGRYPAHKTYEINISWGNSIHFSSGNCFILSVSCVANSGFLDGTQ